MNYRHSYLLVVFLVLGLAGCTVGPNYKRPSVDVPGAYRGVAPDASDQSYTEAQPAAQPTVQSLGDEKWWDVFQDPDLQSLIRTALKNNYDVRIAATRVLQAEAQLGITRADQFPTVTGGGNITSQQSPKIGPIPAYEVTQGALVASASWNPDFWGRYRRATESARATLLANEWAQKAVISTLVANVAASYFTLRQLDLQLEISRRTYAHRKESLDLTQTLLDHGFDTQLDVRQSEQLVYTAASEIPDLERQIALEENAISILLGKNPGDVPRGLQLTDQPHPPEVPAGLPSALLERRPDIREAEQNLVAANAQIGVAKSAYFPQISLTGTAGYESPSLTDLFTGPGRAMESCGILYATHLRGWAAEVRSPAYGSATRADGADVSADNSRCVSRRFERAGLLSQGPRVQNSGAASAGIGTRRRPAFESALQGGNDRLSRSTNERDERILRRTGLGAGPGK